MTKTHNDQSDKLMQARCRLMMREPWYGHIAMGMVWRASDMAWIPEQERTMGVRIMSNGQVECIYYPPFVNSLNIKELFAVIQHEIEHIVRVHCIRVGDREPQAWNIAADMTVNGPKSKPRIGYNDPSTNEIIIPLKDRIIWIPEDWAKDSTSEAYYSQLKKRQHIKVCHSCGRQVKSGNGKPESNESGSNESGSNESGSKISHDSCPICGQSNDNTYEYGDIKGKAIDNHSIWNQSDASDDAARQIVRDLVDEATQKCQGQYPGHLQTAIQLLGKPIVRWREMLRHYLGKHVGNRRVTYSRRNRRHDRFGVPGVSHHAAASVNVIIDTSGSIREKELEQFFAEIDSISSRAKTMVLQWDAAFQGYSPYRRNDWKNFKINGRGGTDMAKPVEWLIANNQIADVQVMLTDGYCNYTDRKNVNFPMITVITNDNTEDPPYGHVVRMKVGLS